MLLRAGAVTTVGPWSAELEWQGSAELYRETPELLAVLRGTLYGQDLDGVLALYRQYGDDFASRVDGAFALLLVDKRVGRVFGLTDRIGTYKLYALDDGQRLCLSTSPDTPDFRQRNISLAGVGSYLVNGYLSNGLTIFETVRSLNPRALHELTPTGIRSRTYWEPRVGGAEGTLSEADAQAELTELLRRALARRLQGAGERHLSLAQWRLRFTWPAQPADPDRTGDPNLLIHPAIDRDQHRCQRGRPSGGPVRHPAPGVDRLPR